MKASLLLAAAFALTTSAAQAQTVAPGAQTGNPSNTPSAGDPSPNQQRVDSKRQDNTAGDKRLMRKGGRIRTTSDGKKVKTERHQLPASAECSRKASAYPGRGFFGVDGLAPAGARPSVPVANWFSGSPY